MYLDAVRGVAPAGSHYWDLASSDSGAVDRLGTLHGTIYGAKNFTGDAKSRWMLSGADYFEVPDHPDLSISTRKALTVAFWAGCSWKGVGGNGEYINFWGKGEGSGTSGQQEYCGRYYLKDSTKGEAPQRVGRMSGYAFNLAGDKGSGSYHQDSACPTAERFFVVVYTMADIKVYCQVGNKMVQQHATVPMSQFSVTPRDGKAPFRFGTRDKSGYFVGTGRRLLIAPTNMSLAAANDLLSAGLAQDSGPAPEPTPPPVVVPPEGSTPTDAEIGAALVQTLRDIGVIK